MPARKVTRYRELLHAGDQSRRRHIPFGHKQRHFVADMHAQLPRQRLAENDLKGLGFQVRKLCTGNALRKFAHPWFLGRINPFDDCAAHDCAGTKEPLTFHEGSNGDNVTLRLKYLFDAFHVGECTFARPDLNVRNHGKHAVAHFLLEAVHHREHDDERGNAKRDGRHRHA